MKIELKQLEKLAEDSAGGLKGDERIEHANGFISGFREAEKNNSEDAIKLAADFFTHMYNDDHPEKPLRGVTNIPYMVRIFIQSGGKLPKSKK